MPEIDVKKLQLIYDMKKALERAKDKKNTRVRWYQIMMVYI